MMEFNVIIQFLLTGNYFKVNRNLKKVSSLKVKQNTDKYMSAYKVNTLMGLGYVKLEQTKTEEQENDLNSLTTFKC